MDTFVAYLILAGIGFVAAIPGVFVMLVVKDFL